MTKPLIQYLILGYLIFMCQKTFPQVNDGIWISWYVKETQTNKKAFDLSGDEIKMVKLDSIRTSFIYHDSYLLLDFLDNSNVVIKRIGEKQTKCKYTINGDEIKIAFEKRKIKGHIYKNFIVRKDKIKTNRRLFRVNLQDKNFRRKLNK